MKNSKRKERMNPTFMKALAFGVLITSSCIFTLIEFNILPLAPTIEILATVVAIVVTLLSLHYVYLEHCETTTMENRLTEDLVAKICADSPHPPNKQLIDKGIRSMLNMQPSHLLRIQALEYYKEDRLALDHLLQRLQREQAHLDILGDLGLSWRPETIHEKVRI